MLGSFVDKTTSSSWAVPVSLVISDRAEKGRTFGVLGSVGLTKRGKVILAATANWQAFGRSIEPYSNVEEYLWILVFPVSANNMS